MLVSITGQAYIFLCTVFGGICVGFIYDMFRISRKVVKTKNIIVYFEDIAFWLLVSLITFATLFISNAGEIRGYALLGIVLGVIIYAFLLSQYVITFVLRVLRFIKRTALFLYKVISGPIKLLMKIILIPINYIVNFLKWLSKLGRKTGRKLRGYVKINFKNIKTTFKKI